MEFSSCQQWKLAFIHAFATVFNAEQEIAPNFFKLPEFTPSQLETEIQKEESKLVHLLVCSSLGNIFNRKYPIESFAKTLCDVVTEKMKTLDIKLEKNPLKNQKFYTLPVDLKLQLLYSMVEWQLQDSQAVRSIIDHHKSKGNNPSILSPVGKDKSKNTYWQFGKSAYLWKESANKKAWERVCKDKEELKEFAETLSMRNSSERELSKYIIKTICPIADRERRKLERLAYIECQATVAADIIAEPVQTRSQKRPREKVNYNYDDFLADTSSDSESEDSQNFSTPPPATKRTRFSNRLNNDVDQEEDGDEEIEKSEEENEEENREDIQNKRKKKVQIQVQIDEEEESVESEEDYEEREYEDNEEEEEDEEIEEVEGKKTKKEEEEEEKEEEEDYEDEDEA
ncbi:unnamed protein product [Rhizopus stolonifer]